MSTTSLLTPSRMPTQLRSASSRFVDLAGGIRWRKSVAKRAERSGTSQRTWADYWTTERKASAWLGQRKAIATELTKVRDKANELLRQLTGGAADMAVAVGLARGTRRGRPPGSKSIRKARRRRPFTAAQRKEVSARMKKYWAGRRATEARRKRTAKKALKA